MARQGWTFRKMRGGRRPMAGEFVRLSVRTHRSDSYRGVIGLSIAWCRMHVVIDHRGIEIQHDPETRQLWVRPTVERGDGILAFTACNHPVQHAAAGRGYSSADRISIGSLLIALRVPEGGSYQWPLVQDGSWWRADLTTEPKRRRNGQHGETLATEPGAAVGIPGEPG